MSFTERAIVRTIGVLGVLTVVFFTVQGPFRTAEATLCANLATLIAPHRALEVQGPYILVVPYHSEAFVAYVSPTCSSLAPMLALLCLSTILPRNSGPRRVIAALLSMTLVFVGNLLRIGASVLAGIYAGRGSLVLFHNWVGSAFTFLYILGGFMLMIAVMLPSSRRRPEEVQDALAS
jgi:exosortase/archaeosortase family protein